MPIRLKWKIDIFDKISVYTNLNNKTNTQICSRNKIYRVSIISDLIIAL